MTNHPNRSKAPGPASTPTQAQIVAARAAAGLTQSEAAAVIYSTLRTWQDWEGGQRKMNAALLELFQLKTGQRKL
jgi:putative transcriptional regulator